MPSLGNVPEWLGAALIGAAIAFIGFVGKSIVESVNSTRQERQARRAELVELHSLLRAGRVTFVIQNEHAAQLLEMVRAKHPSAARAEGGYERVFASAFDQFTPEERELHGIIRSMTVSALAPTNQAILDWIRRDRYYKSHPPSHRELGRLSTLLGDLEAHLVLWKAKYEGWIPNTPAHALVYLADESNHGLGFPAGIDDEVARVLGLSGSSSR